MKFFKWLGIGLAWQCVACATTQDPAVNDGAETVVSSETVQEPVGAKVEDRPVGDYENMAAIQSKYETIEYGQQLPFVCQTAVDADGRLSKRPNLQVMWENYLYDRPDGIWGEIGGMVEVNGNLPLDQGRWTNACTVRLSHMLNQAGHKIPRQSDNASVSGSNRDQYIYRLRDMEAYLTDAFGAPDVAINDGSADSFDLPTRPGIVLMDYPGSTFNGHTTIWNGAGSVDNADIGGHRVLFWDMPCFIPEDRNKTPVAALTDRAAG